MCMLVGVQRAVNLAADAALSSALPSKTATQPGPLHSACHKMAGPRSQGVCCPDVHESMLRPTPLQLCSAARFLQANPAACKASWQRCH
jgi:hypothetical protein